MAARIMTTSALGLCSSIYFIWDFADRGPLWSSIVAITGRDIPNNKNIPPSTITRPQLQSMLTQKTIHHVGPGAPRNWESFVLSNFTHRHFIHLAFNMIAWNSFAQLFHGLPPIHYAALIAGSAVSSSLLFEYQHQRGMPAAGLGASGIVSGLAMATTLIIPTARVALFGIVPAPLWLFTTGFFAMDTYVMQQEMRGNMNSGTGIGHSAHVGGGLFGALYYAMVLRRFGGVLGPRRFR